MQVITKAISNLAVTTAKIALDAIDGTLIGDDVLDSEHYAAGSIDLEHMSANSVDSAEIVAGAIDLAHMSVNSIDSDQYVDGSIDLAHMSANSVDSAQYVDGSIDLIHMSVNSVDSDQYVDGSIDLLHMSADSVDSMQYVDGSIDGVHLSTDAKGTVLQSQFLAEWVQISAATSGTSTSLVVTTAVEAAATDTTEQNTVAALGILTSSTTTGSATASENYRVQIRQSGTDNPVLDLNGDEVFGVLEKTTTVWTLHFREGDDTGSYTFTGSISIDYMFAQVADLDTLSGTALLHTASFGNIGGSNHTHASLYTLTTDLASNANAKGASTIGLEDVSAYYTGTDLEALANELEAQLGGDTSTTFNFTEANVLADNDAVYAALEKLDLYWGDLASTASGEGASRVGIFDTAGNFTSTDVEGALAELASDITASADQQNGQTDKFTPTTGQVAFTLSSVPLGDSVVCSVAGVVQEKDDGTALTGTVTFTNASTAVTGSGTAFSTEIAVGEYIQLTADADPVKVASIETNTGLTLSAIYPATGGAGASKVHDTGDYFVNGTAFDWFDKDFTLATTDLIQMSFVKDA